jgi:hypothetical protein
VQKRVYVRDPTVCVPESLSEPGEKESEQESKEEESQGVLTCPREYSIGFECILRLSGICAGRKKIEHSSLFANVVLRAIRAPPARYFTDILFREDYWGPGSYKACYLAGCVDQCRQGYYIGTLLNTKLRHA